MKSLVIYFSHTGENYIDNGIKVLQKGNTEVVAEKISSFTNADLLKVEPINEYPKEYHKCCEVAKTELEKNLRPEIKNEIPDISSYDIIYIGGPVWWSHYPLVLFTLLEKINFTNKIIKPFVSHEESGFGSTIDDINSLCEKGIIKSGLAIRGSEVNSSTKLIESWCKK